MKIRVRLWPQVAGDTITGWNVWEVDANDKPLNSTVFYYGTGTTEEQAIEDFKRRRKPRTFEQLESRIIELELTEVRDVEV